MDINIHTDFTKMTEAELIQIEKRWDPVSQVYLKVVSERQRRLEVKEQKDKKWQIITLLIAIIGLIIAIIDLILHLF